MLFPRLFLSNFLSDRHISSADKAVALLYFCNFLKNVASIGLMEFYLISLINWNLAPT